MFINKKNDGKREMKFIGRDSMTYLVISRESVYGIWQIWCKNIQKWFLFCDMKIMNMKDNLI